MDGSFKIKKIKSYLSAYFLYKSFVRDFLLSEFLNSSLLTQSLYSLFVISNDETLLLE